MKFLSPIGPLIDSRCDSRKDGSLLLLFIVYQPLPSGGVLKSSKMKFKIRNKEDREAVKEYIDKLPEGKTYNAEIVRKTTKRSLDQNNLYWLWLSYLAKELGYTQEELHSVFALKFLGASHRVIYEETIVNIPSTKKLTTEQFSAYLEQIYIFAVTELDIQLPQPQDRCFEQFYEQYKNII